MKKRLTTLLLASLALSSCGLMGGGTEKQLARAEATLNAGKYAEAVIALLNLAKEKAGNGQVLLMLARAQYLRGDPQGVDQALSAAEQAKADPATIAEIRARVAVDRRQFAELLRDLDAGKYPLPEKVGKRYRARALQGMGNPVEALAIYGALLESEPNSVDLHLFAAECHAMLGRAQMARDQVDRAMAIQPNSASAWRLRSRLSPANDTDAASLAVQKAIEYAPGQLSAPEQVALLATEFQRAADRLDAPAAGAIQKRLLAVASDSPLTQWTQAQISLIQGRPTEADATLQRLVQRASDFAPGRPALIGALLAADSLELAIQESASLAPGGYDPQRLNAIQQALKQAADAKAGSEERVARSAFAAQLLGQSPAARWMIEEGLKAHPTSESLTVLAIQQQLSAGQTKQAVERAQSVVVRLPQDSGAKAMLAMAQAANGDFAASQQIYEALWKGVPSSGLVLALTQARLRTHQGDPLEPSKHWLDSHPNDLAVRIGLASAAMGLGQNDLALAEYERIVAAQPNNALALNNLAWLYSKRSDGRALATAKRAHDAATASPEVADTYGWLLAESGDARAALPLLAAAARALPSRPEIRYHYAAVMARSATPADKVTARRWLADLLREPSSADWRADAQRLLAQLPES